MINDKAKKHLIKNINNKKIDSDLLLIIYFLLKDNKDYDVRTRSANIQDEDLDNIKKNLNIDIKKDRLKELYNKWDWLMGEGLIERYKWDGDYNNYRISNKGIKEIDNIVRNKTLLSLKNLKWLALLPIIITLFVYGDRIVNNIMTLIQHIF